jgi:hypothetical protein
MANAKRPSRKIPEDLAKILKSITQALGEPGQDGRQIGSSRLGVYAFFDYDQEPIYVGQTKERLRVRIRRHLTNQRTDAVAMNVLDPLEVAFIEMWPLDGIAPKKMSLNATKDFLNRAEYAAFQAVLSGSTFKAVLNEKEIRPQPPFMLPKSYRFQIVPGPLFEAQSHPDVRIARRAATIANLARVISERSVSKGLRATLITQARRLENLAVRRAKELGVKIPDFQGEPSGGAPSKSSI